MSKSQSRKSSRSRSKIASHDEGCPAINKDSGADEAERISMRADTISSASSLSTSQDHQPNLGIHLSDYFNDISPDTMMQIMRSQGYKLDGSEGFGLESFMLHRFEQMHAEDLVKREAPHKTLEELMEPQIAGDPYYYKYIHFRHFVSANGLRNLAAIICSVSFMLILAISPSAVMTYEASQTNRNWLFDVTATHCFILHALSIFGHASISIARVTGVFHRYRNCRWAYIRGSFYYFYQFFILFSGIVVMGTHQMGEVQLHWSHWFYIASSVFVMRYYLSMASREFQRGRTRAPEERFNDPDGTLARLERLNERFKPPALLRKKNASFKKGKRQPENMLPAAKVAAASKGSIRNV